MRGSVSGGNDVLGLRLVLESSASLSAPNWQAVATGGTNVVAVPLEASSRFFRLNLDGIRGLCCAPQ